jgi:short-subunit dehydrogenase
MSDLANESDGAQQRPLAVVTGASSGIGFELAKLLLGHAFDVVMVAEDDRLQVAVRQLSAEPGTAIPVQVDLAASRGVDELHRQITGLGRPVEVLALNAGVGVGGEFVTTSLDADRNLIQLNVMSVVHLAKLILPSMVARGQGRVLITASIASLMPGPYYATYAASKSFLLSFAEAIRHELKEQGVTVTALMPGPTDTDFFRRAGMDDTRAASGHKDSPADVALDGFTAMMAGDDHVVAGSAKNKLQALGAKAMPDTAKAAMHARLTEPQSGAD